MLYVRGTSLSSIWMEGAVEHVEECMIRTFSSSISSTMVLQRPRTLMHVGTCALPLQDAQARWLKRFLVPSFLGVDCGKVWQYPVSPRPFFVQLHGRSLRAFGHLKYLGG